MGNLCDIMINDEGFSQYDGKKTELLTKMVWTLLFLLAAKLTPQSCAIAVAK